MLIRNRMTTVVYFFCIVITTITATQALADKPQSDPNGAVTLMTASTTVGATVGATVSAENSCDCSFKLFDPYATGLIQGIQRSGDEEVESSQHLPAITNVETEISQPEYDRQVQSSALPVESSYSEQADATMSFSGDVVQQSGSAQLSDDTEQVFDDFAEVPTIETYLVVDASWEGALRSDHLDNALAWPVTVARTAAGFGSQHFRRVGLGLGWTANSRTKARLEFGQDWFDGKGSSPLAQSIDNKNFVGLEIVSSF